MSNQNNQGNGPVASAIPQTDVQLLMTMVQLLMEEKAELLADKKQQKLRNAAKDEAYQKLSDYNVEEEHKKQTICTHLKGGRGPKNAKVDYALYHHTFPDASTYIRCQICGMKWKKGDTEETIRRFGKDQPNHTGISWRQAVQLLASSTNTPTTSEVPMKVATPIVEA